MWHLIQMHNIYPIDYIVPCISKSKQKKKILNFVLPITTNYKFTQKLSLRPLIKFFKWIIVRIFVHYQLFHLVIYFFECITKLQTWGSGQRDAWCQAGTVNSSLTMHQPVPLPPFVPSLQGAHSSAGTIARFTSPLITPQPEFRFSGQDRLELPPSMAFWKRQA